MSNCARVVIIQLRHFWGIITRSYLFYHYFNFGSSTSRVGSRGKNIRRAGVTARVESIEEARYLIGGHTSNHRMTSAAEQKMTPSAARASSFRVGRRASCTFKDSRFVGDGVEVAARLIDPSHNVRWCLSGMRSFQGKFVSRSLAESTWGRRLIGGHGVGE